MLAVVLFFFGQQPQQYLVPNLVARRIIPGNGNQLAIPHDVNIFALSGALHRDLQGSCAKHIITECDPLPDHYCSPRAAYFRYVKEPMSDEETIAGIGILESLVTRPEIPTW